MWLKISWAFFHVGLTRTGRASQMSDSTFLHIFIKMKLMNGLSHEAEMASIRTTPNVNARANRLVLHFSITRAMFPLSDQPLPMLSHPKPHYFPPKPIIRPPSRWVRSLTFSHGSLHPTCWCLETLLVIPDLSEQGKAFWQKWILKMWDRWGRRLGGWGGGAAIAPQKGESGRRRGGPASVKQGWVSRFKGDFHIMILQQCIAYFKDLITTAY